MTANQFSGSTSRDPLTIPDCNQLTSPTVIMRLLQTTGHKYKLDQPDKVSGLPQGTHIPFDTDIKIFNR